MLYEVYEQHPPINSKRKDRGGYPIIEADLRFVKTIDVPVGNCPIEYAREKTSIAHPLVSAVYCKVIIRTQMELM